MSVPAEAINYNHLAAAIYSAPSIDDVNSIIDGQLEAAVGQYQNLIDAVQGMYPRGMKVRKQRAMDPNDHLHVYNANLGLAYRTAGRAVRDQESQLDAQGIRAANSILWELITTTPTGEPLLTEEITDGIVSVLPQMLEATPPIHLVEDQTQFTIDEELGDFESGKLHPVEEMVREYKDNPRIKGIQLVTHLSNPDRLTQYMHEIGQISLLTKDDEARLGQEIQDGLTAWQRGGLEADIIQGVRAYHTFVNSNLRLVASRARVYQGDHGIPLYELVQYGNLGLLHGVAKFDHTKGFKFSTYGVNWINQSITRSLADEARIVRLPVHVAEKGAKITTFIQDFSAKNGREPTDAELMTRFKVTSDVLAGIRSFVRRGDLLSLDEPFTEDGEATLGSILPSQRNNIGEFLGGVAIGEDFTTAFQDVPLTHQERMLLSLRYGVLVPGIDPSTPLPKGGITLDEGVQRVQNAQLISLGRDEEPRLRNDKATHRIIGEYLDLDNNETRHIETVATTKLFLTHISQRLKMDERETVALFEHFLPEMGNPFEVDGDIGRTHERLRRAEMVLGILEIGFTDYIRDAITTVVDTHTKGFRLDDKRQLQRYFWSRFGLGPSIELNQSVIFGPNRRRGWRNFKVQVIESQILGSLLKK